MKFLQTQKHRLDLKERLDMLLQKMEQEVKISVHGGIYSYGILILEMITGKRPTDDIFTESLNLREYVRNAFPNNFTGIIDPYLLAQFRHCEGSEDNSLRRIKLECINVTLEIGLLCSR